MKPIDLIWLGSLGKRPNWHLGEVWPVVPTPAAVSRLVQELLPTSVARAWYFWDEVLGEPDETRVQEAMAQPGDVWHAGLSLGLGGLPELIDFVVPTWMLNRDPPADREATSWRLSLRCCLARLDVLRQMGCVHPEFTTLAGASLEMGCRYLRRGVITRHIPWLLPPGFQAPKPPKIPLEDEVRFVLYQFGSMWGKWAMMRAVLTKSITLRAALETWRRVGTRLPPCSPKPFSHTNSFSPKDAQVRVTVLIPTLERYDHLRRLLDQLRLQTVKPYEIIVVDQTPEAWRDNRLPVDFSDLPLRVLYLDRPGQSSARNTGLRIARGEFILFLDDDDEVTPWLIEEHLSTLLRFGAEVSSGVAYVPCEGPLPDDFSFLRASDVFPTNNTLVHRRVLELSGLFDLAYEKGARADGDLGMRVYASGALMILNPAIAVVHHHAPTGGLRVHKARQITYASSRRSLIQRHLPEKTEIYLVKRYFTPRQVREALWQRTFGTFRLKGSRLVQVGKILAGIALFPDTWRHIREMERQSEQMLRRFPEIPELIDFGFKTSPSLKLVLIKNHGLSKPQNPPVR